MNDVRILTVSSCTGSKSVSCPNPLVAEDFREPEQLRLREEELAHLRRPAAEMYTGLQHIWTMEGVNAIRDRFGTSAAELKIISAGYGLLSERELIAPYDVTFTGMTPSAIAELARCQRLAEDVRGALRGFPLVVFLLGASYLHVVAPPVHAEPGQRIVFLAKSGEAKRLQSTGVTVVPAGQLESRAYGAMGISLKGKMFRLFALSLADEGASLYDRVREDDTAESFLRALNEKSRP